MIIADDNPQRQIAEPGRCALPVILGQDAALLLAQFLARLQPDLVEQDRAGPPVGLERLHSPAAIMQGPHPEGPQPFAVRHLGEHRLQLTERAFRIAGLDPRHHPVLTQLIPDFLKPVHRGHSPQRIRYRLIRTPPPQAECLVGQQQRAVRDAFGQCRRRALSQAYEAGRVCAFRLRRQPVATGVTDQDGGARTRPVRIEQLTQPPDVRLKGCPRPRRDLLTPQRVHQLVRGDPSIHPDEKQGQDCCRFHSPGRQFGPIALDKYGPQVAVPH